MVVDTTQQEIKMTRRVLMGTYPADEVTKAYVQAVKLFHLNRSGYVQAVFAAMLLENRDADLVYDYEC